MLLKLEYLPVGLLDFVSSLHCDKDNSELVFITRHFRLISNHGMALKASLLCLLDYLPTHFDFKEVAARYVDTVRVLLARSPPDAASSTLEIDVALLVQQELSNHFEYSSSLPIWSWVV